MTAAARKDQEQQIRVMRVALRQIVAKAVLTQSITPQAVYAYAALHLTDDAGRPLYPAAHHQLWMELACSPIKKLLIIAPPESAKTTWMLSAFVGLYIGVYPERSVIIGSVSGPVAEKRSLSLRVTVEQPGWTNTFPAIKRAVGLPWKTNEWSLAVDGKPHAGRLHPTVAAYGTGGSVVGARADLIMSDDLLDMKNTTTAHQREFVERWFHTVLLSRRKAGTGRIIAVGTSYHHDDLYAHLKQDGGWVVCHIPLLSRTKEVAATITYPDDFVGERLGRPVGMAIQELPAVEQDTMLVR